MSELDKTFNISAADLVESISLSDDRIQKLQAHHVLPIFYTEAGIQEQMNTLSNTGTIFHVKFVDNSVEFNIVSIAIWEI